MSTTFERLSQILTREYGLAPERLGPRVALDALGLDSLRAVELMWLVEEAFDLQLTAEPVQLKTLADVTGFIDALLLQQGRVPVSAGAGASAKAPAVAQSAPRA